MSDTQENTSGHRLLRKCLQLVVSDAPAQFASVGTRFLGDRVKDIETLTFS